MIEVKITSILCAVFTILVCALYLLIYKNDSSFNNCRIMCLPRPVHSMTHGDCNCETGVEAAYRWNDNSVQTMAGCPAGQYPQWADGGLQCISK